MYRNYLISQYFSITEIFRLVFIFSISSIAIYVAGTFLNQAIYIPNWNEDEFHTYQNSMAGDCALPTILINILIVVSALLPDLTWLVFRGMTLDGTQPLNSNKISRTRLIKDDEP